MRALIKVMLIVGAAFATTFILGRIFGVLTVENITNWLEVVQTTNPIWVASLVIVLLFIDLFVAVPTLTITILAGYFLGFPTGLAAALTGMSLAAFSGYTLSWMWGTSVLRFLVKDNGEQEALCEAFQISGPMMIMLSRAAPIMPELTACMAGATKMPFFRYVIYYSVSTIPYAAIAAYAGSISSIDSPQPAIYAVLFLYGFLWLGWFWIKKRKYQANNPSNGHQAMDHSPN